MKARPILFSGPMVRALLAGTKTQTRRVAGKTVRHPDLGNLYTPGALVLEHEPQHVIDRCCPYGQPGDRLWVRETWQGPLLQEFEIDADTDWHYASHLHQYQNPEHCEYAADGGPKPEYMDADDVMRQGWRPSIHMPRWASRITLEVISVRVERLQDISEADALAEGVPNSLHLSGGRFARENFAHLWWTIHGDDAWAANPWVWVIEFNQTTPNR